MKKFIVPISVCAVAILLLLSYLLFFTGPNVYKAIPASALAVVEINDWTKFQSELDTKQSAMELKRTAALKKLVTETAFLQQFTALLSPKLKAQLTTGKITASAHLIAAGDFDYLFTIPANGINTKAIDHDLMMMGATLKTASVTTRIFKGQQVADVVMKDGTKFCITSIKGVLAFSNTAFLTEAAVTAATGGNNLDNDKELGHVLKKLNAGEAVKVFINFKRSDVILPVAFNAGKLSLLADLQKFTTWAGFSITFDDDKLKIAGIGAPGDESKSSAETRNILASTIWNFIPDNAAYVHADFNELNGEKKTEPGKNDLGKNSFKDWAGDAHAFVTLEPLNDNFNQQNVFIIQVKDKSKALTDLKSLINVDGGKALPVDTFGKDEIYKLNGGAIINQVFGGSFNVFGCVYFGVTNQAAVFCSSADQLKFVLEKTGKGETLNRDETCRKTLEGAGKPAGALYLNASRSHQLFSGLIQDTSSLKIYLMQQNSLAFSYGVDNGWINMQGVVLTGAGSKTSAGLLWKTKLQALSTYTPQIVTNEVTGDKEIFTQDTLNNVYLISKSGEIIFTRNFGEKIISSVYQLDYYNNGQLQYVFNTPYHVFMLDRTGADAASYPLRLSNAATGGLVLVNTGNKYRYFVPCINGAVYGYEANGRPLSNWSPRSGLGLITQPLQVFKSGKSDYMLVFNNSGKLMLLGSKGETKWTMNNLPSNIPDFCVMKTGDDFTVINASGNQLIQVSADGNDNMKPLVDSAASFTSISTSDSDYLYFFSGLHDVRSFNSHNEFKKAVGTKNDLIGGIAIAAVDSVNYLLVKNVTAGKIQLYDLQLKPVAEYPVTGINQFVIADLFNRNELIGINPDGNGNICCYRIK